MVVVKYFDTWLDILISGAPSPALQMGADLSQAGGEKQNKAKIRTAAYAILSATAAFALLQVPST